MKFEEFLVARKQLFDMGFRRIKIRVPCMKRKTKPFWHWLDAETEEMV